MAVKIRCNPLEGSRTIKHNRTEPRSMGTRAHDGHTALLPLILEIGPSSRSATRDRHSTPSAGIPEKRKHAIRSPQRSYVTSLQVRESMQLLRRIHKESNPRLGATVARHRVFWNSQTGAGSGLEELWRTDGRIPRTSSSARLLARDGGCATNRIRGSVGRGGISSSCGGDLHNGFLRG